MYESIISDFFESACLRFNWTVFLLSCASRICLLSTSSSSLIDATSFLNSAISFFVSLNCLLTFVVLTFNSSISRRRPRRFPAFLNAPPVIEPPGFNCSPSSVTILKECLYFLAIASALSILSTTRILPRRYFARFSYSNEILTRLLATPITPFSFMHGSFSIVFLPDIDDKGRNVARPNLFSLRYAIRFFAVFSLSVTIFWIVPPRAVSIAVSYFFSTLIISAITPIIPSFSDFSSIIFLMLLP